MDNDKFGSLNWNFLSFEYSDIQDLNKAHDLVPILSKMVLAENLQNSESLSNILRPPTELIQKIEYIAHPKEQDKAMDRLKLALQQKEKIMVNGDPDADGISGAVVLVAGLRHIGYHVFYDFPVRCREGHGIQPRIIDEAKKEGCSILLTTDCGSKDREAVDYANEQGLDVIICDHHVLGKKSPNALAMINPNTLGYTSPYQKLAGAGVSLKFIQILFSVLDKEIPEFLEKFLLTVASLGTISDRMSLREPLNRIIVSKGVEYLNDTNREGLKALLDVSFPWKRKIKARDISRTIVPRLNAPGRIGDPSKNIPDSNLVVDLLLIGIGKKNAAKASEVVQKFADVYKMKNNVTEAAKEASLIDDVNEERKKITSKIEDEIELLIEQQIDTENDKIIVIQGKNWNPGVIGIDTDRLRDRFRRPAMIITEYDGDDFVRGSVRSIPSIDVYSLVERAGEAFEEANGRPLFVHEVASESGAQLVDAFGGHSQACGFSLHKKDLPEFLKKIREIMSKLEIDDFQMTYNILDTLKFEEINSKFVDVLEGLSPFGEGFPFPIFCLSCCRIVKGRPFGNRYQTERTPHIEFGVFNDNLQDRNRIDATGYGMFDKFTNLVHPSITERYDIIFTFDSGYMKRGSRKVAPLRLNVIDIKLSK